MSFNTREIVEKVFESKYLTPGINEVTIANVEGNNGAEGKSPFITVNFTKMGDVTKTASVRFFMSDAAKARSLEKVKHIATKVTTADKFDAVGDTATDVVSYASGINNLLAGKSLRIKFSGEEVIGGEGKKNWFKAVIGLPAFAEALTVNPSKLKFDPNNQYDMKRTTAVPATSGTSVYDLPF